jgi:hypothetical protein
MEAGVGDLSESVDNSLANDANDFRGGAIRIIMFPESKHPPTRCTKSDIGQTISLHVSPDLFPPPTSIRTWPSHVVRTAVPETAIHEHDHFRAAKDDVRATRALRGADVYTIPETVTMDGVTNGYLRRSIPSWRRLHSLTHQGR